jgi:mono/diheme cytochrome c family protein|tara:strand:+ start:1574 stop:2122 length:549 start_codon:yes stop_codon:yes gene_type:complete
LKWIIKYTTGLILAFALTFPVNAQQIDGEAIFNGYCMACHTIGSGNLVGPDLKGVNSRYEKDWLLNFIKSSQTMVANGDERAVKVFNQFSNIPMPDQPLSDDEVKALLAFIEVRTTALDEEEKVASQVAEPGENTPDNPGSALATSKDPFQPFMWVIFGLFFIIITLLVTFIMALLHLKKII